MTLWVETDCDSDTDALWCGLSLTALWFTMQTHFLTDSEFMSGALWFGNGALSDAVLSLRQTVILKWFLAMLILRLKRAVIQTPILWCWLGIKNWLWSHKQVLLCMFLLNDADSLWLKIGTCLTVLSLETDCDSETGTCWCRLRIWSTNWWSDALSDADSELRHWLWFGDSLTTLTPEFETDCDSDTEALSDADSELGTDCWSGTLRKRTKTRCA